jgi:sialate O-acetylesterase
MVLQQQLPIRVWGWGDAGESVRVSLGDRNAAATVNADGRWQVELPPLQASSQPLVLTIQANNTIEIKDVLIGEVWLCSGQSNMEWTVQSSSNAQAEIAAAKYPQIRHLKIEHRPSMTPLDDVQAQWQVCSPETVADFTAVGYFMARDLQQQLQVPVGLVNSSWGGTRVEPWTPPGGFKSVDALQDIYRSVEGRTPGSDAYRSRLAQHIEASERWIELAKQALETTEPLAPSPAYPNELLPFQTHQDPTMLYNGMIHALVGFPIRGAIWYQGESNHTEGMLYAAKKKALIGGWRELWGQGDFPFYYVQIAPFRYGEEDPAILAQFWEAQAAVSQIPNTGMVVINDIATLDDIHPPNKQDVGHRLALLALKRDYGQEDVIAESPSLESVEVREGSLRVKFANTGGGLKTRDGQAPTHFEVVGPGSRGYHQAQAVIDGDAVTLTCESVAQPVAFRFAWNKLAEPNLTGGSGLPVGAVRGGEEPDFSSLLSIEQDYRLVYDLDLGKLGGQFSYDVDHSEQTIAYDRIGYLLELASGPSASEQVFVSVPAFTEDLKKIGIPTAKSGAMFQQSVPGLEVFTTSIRLGSGSFDSGQLEFWPNNYGPRNASGIAGASDTSFDFGDEPAPPLDGYGSMQIHNPALKQTVLAINHWSAGSDADIGIGNSSGANPDWTFSRSGGAYSSKRLRVYVRPLR